VPPQNDPLVQAINATANIIKTNALATNTAVGSLLGGGSICALVQDIYDSSFGSWNIDQTVTPPVLYLKRVNGNVFASFQLVSNNTNTQRNTLTNPGDSSI
jgi:hypothetical protein